MKTFIKQAKDNYHQAISISNVNDLWTNQICRRFASVIVILINKTFLTPNQVTIISFLVNIMANYLLIFNYLLFAALLYFLSYVFDCVDGQLARVRNVVSNLGMYLDPIFDGLKDLITFLVLIAYFSDTNLFIISLIAMFNVSASIIFDWVRHTIQRRPKDLKENYKNFFQKYGIVFWSVPIRNMILVICLVCGQPSVIIYYASFIGIYFTIRKGWGLILMINKIESQ